MFANLFRPKWRHSSPQVRVRAVVKLRADHPAHGSILRELALEDSSTEVRLAALERIGDPELALQILARERDPQLRACAGTTIARWLNAQSDAAGWEQWLRRLPDDTARAALVLGDAPADLKPVTLELIEEPQVLLQLAIEAPTAALRRASAERVSAPELLETLLRESRSRDKAVHRLARERLNALREAEQEQARIEQTRALLLEQLHHLISSEDRQHFQVRAELIQRDWLNLPAPSAEIAQQFEQHWAQVQTIMQEHSARQAEEKARAQAEAAHRSACQQQAEVLQALLQDDIDATNSSTLQLELQKTLELSEQAPLTAELTALQQQANKRLKALARLQEHQTELVSLLEQPVSGKVAKAIGRQLELIDWPAALATPALLKQARNQLKLAESAEQQRRSEASQHTQQLEADLQALEQAIEQGEIRVAEHQYERAHEQLQQLNGSTPAPLEHRFKSLTARLHEIRDWQGFAVNGKKETLCSKMEALVGSPLEPRLLAEQIRTLQQEWKQLDAGSTVHSQRLWQRFRTAGEAAYSPCEAHFAAQRELRRHNLNQREEICQQLEQFLAVVDWDSADWPAVERISHTAKREWKQFSPVDRSPGRAVQQRFNQTIRTLDHKLRDWHQQCEQLKRSLIDQAAELAASEDIRAAAEAAKTLQRQWKQTGPAFRSQERELWQAFRSHCDQIFAQLKEEQSRPAPAIAPVAAEPLLGNAQQQAFDNCVKLLNQAESALLDGDAGMLPALLGALAQAIRKVPAPWQQALQLRVDQASLLLEQPDQLEELLGQSEHRLRELCIRLEILLNQPSPEEDQAQRMEYQMLRLQQALAEQNRSASQADVQALELEWQTVPWNAVYPHLQLRFDTLLQQTHALSPS